MGKMDVEHGKRPRPARGNERDRPLDRHVGPQSIKIVRHGAVIDLQDGNSLPQRRLSRYQQLELIKQLSSSWDSSLQTQVFHVNKNRSSCKKKLDFVFDPCAIRIIEASRGNGYLLSNTELHGAEAKRAAAAFKLFSAGVPVADIKGLLNPFLSDIPGLYGSNLAQVRQFILTALMTNGYERYAKRIEAYWSMTS